MIQNVGIWDWWQNGVSHCRIGMDHLGLLMAQVQAQFWYHMLRTLQVMPNILQSASSRVTIQVPLNSDLSWERRWWIGKQKRGELSRSPWCTSSIPWVVLSWQKERRVRNRMSEQNGKAGAKFWIAASYPCTVSWRRSTSLSNGGHQGYQHILAAWTTASASPLMLNPSCCGVRRQVNPYFTLFQTILAMRQQRVPRTAMSLITPSYFVKAV